MGVESGSEGVGVANAVGIASDVKIVLRSYLSTNHLYAAHFAANDAQDRENSLAGDENLFDLRHRGYVLTAIVESVAFLEAAINEIYKDAFEGRGSYSEELAEDCKNYMAALWGAAGDRLPVLDKYDLALSFAGKELLAKGEEPYQSARLLILVRNYVVHYKPHDRSTDDPHAFEKSLKGKFADNLLMDGSGNPWFPDHAFGAGCADWSWRAARSFAEEFGRRIDIRLNFQVADFSENLPL
ncbi:hypothetical protein [Streptomyces parvulus]|uniref:hypothetical protein n=1 Tax=Streptomyces parvulus TaxID=146923 RepID=UPI003EC09BC8